MMFLPIAYSMNSSYTFPPKVMKKVETFFLDGQYLPFQNSLRFLDIGVDLFHQSFPSFVDFHYFISVRILFTVFIKIFGFMLIPATV